MLKPFSNFDRNFYKSDKIMPAHKCQMCITTMREITEGKGDEHFKKVKEEWTSINGNEFRKNLIEDSKKGITHDIEVVYEKPAQFVFNKIYLLATRKKMWVWVLEPTEE